MRKKIAWALLFLVLAVLPPLFSQNLGVEKKLIGVWLGTGEKSQPIQFTFGPGNAVQGKDGVSVDVGTYRFDSSRTPGHIDLIFKEAGRVETIITFLSDNKIRIENNSPGDDRPRQFTWNSVVLMRKDAPPEPERKRPASPAAMSPQEAGEEIADLYYGAHVQANETLKDHPPVETAKALMRKLKEDFIQKLVPLGRRRESMTAAEKKALEDAFDEAAMLRRWDQLNASFWEVRDFYENKDKQLYELIRSFEYLDKYSRFEDLKNDEPGEARRLGIK